MREALRARSCALPMDGRNACPPEAGSCFVCPWFQLDGRAARAEERAHERARLVDALAATGRSGLTVEQLTRCAQLREPVVRSRLAELEAEGVVRRRNARRRTRAGGRAAVFVTVEPRPAAGGTP